MKGATQYSGVLRQLVAVAGLLLVLLLQRVVPVAAALGNPIQLVQVEPLTKVTEAVTGIPPPPPLVAAAALVALVAITFQALVALVALVFSVRSRAQASRVAAAVVVVDLVVLLVEPRPQEAATVVQPLMGQTPHQILAAAVVAAQAIVV